jgi:hypothetical protein
MKGYWGMVSTWRDKEKDSAVVQPVRVKSRLLKLTPPSQTAILCLPKHLLIFLKEKSSGHPLKMRSGKVQWTTGGF